jgi:serine/threonine protein kinase
VTVFQVDSYEYLHTAGWVHKDVKGSNILFSLHGPSDGKVFLVDYGLVSKLTR